MIDLDPGKSWFLTQFKPNSHRIASRNLARQGFPVFLPLQRTTRRAGGRFVTQLRPLFPGYLFVALDPKRGEAWRAINATPGVTRLVTLGQTPTPVPNDLVTELMRRCDHESVLVPATPHAPGDTVTLSCGPFSDFIATVESIAADRRIWVLLDFMGAQTRVAVPAGDLGTA